jgi:hypothetical protein
VLGRKTLKIFSGVRVCESFVSEIVELSDASRCSLMTFPATARQSVRLPDLRPIPWPSAIPANPAPC